MVACSRCRPVCPPAGSNRSPRARWFSGSPASSTSPTSLIHATRCSLVHRALELAFWPRRPSAPPTASTRASPSPARSSAATPNYVALELDDEATATFDDECRGLVTGTSTMEDPRAVQPIGLELRLSASGRVALPARHHRPPGAARRRAGRDGLQDRSRSFAELGAEEPGRRALLLVPVRAGPRSPPGGDPADVPQQRRDDRGRAVLAVGALHLTTRTHGACWPWSGPAPPATSRPRPSARCQSCGYQTWCPSFGGDPERADAEAPHSTRRVARRRSRR